MSILDRAREDSERLDWLTVPYDQRIIDDDTLEWLCGTSKLLEDVPLAEYKLFAGVSVPLGQFTSLKRMFWRS